MFDFVLFTLGNNTVVAIFSYSGSVIITERIKHKKTVKNLFETKNKKKISIRKKTQSSFTQICDK